MRLKGIAGWAVGVASTTHLNGDVDTVADETMNKVVVEVETLTGGWNSYDIHNPTPENPWTSVTTSTPTIIDESKLPTSVERLSPGIGFVTVANSKSSVVKQYNLTDLPGNGTRRRVTSILPGGYPEYSFNLVTGVLDASTDNAVFLNTTSNIYNENLTYNPSGQAAAFDLTAIPARHKWGSYFNGGGILITPRHVWVTHHYREPVGQTLIFIGSDNIHYPRTIVGITHSDSPNDIFDSNHIKGDMMVYVLDADLPATVTPMKVCGSWIADQFNLGGSPETYEQNTYLRVDQQRNLYWCSGIIEFPDGQAQASGEINNVAITDIHPTARTQISAAHDWNGTTWYRVGSEPVPYTPYMDKFRSLIGGDSGSPVMALLSSSELCVVSIATTPVGGASSEEFRLNTLIGDADRDAAERGVPEMPTGYTVTVAPDPTLP